MFSLAVEYFWHKLMAVRDRVSEWIDEFDETMATPGAEDE